MYATFQPAPIAVVLERAPAAVNVIVVVYADMPHSIVRLYATRGGRGKDGKQPLTQTRICDMNDEWLQAVLDYGGAEWHLNIIRNEIEYRTKTRTSSN